MNEMKLIIAGKSLQEIEEQIRKYLPDAPPKEITRLATKARYEYRYYLDNGHLPGVLPYG